MTIGDLAGRTGLSVSAIRFYEAKGLIHPDRNSGGQRRFAGADIRRLSFVMIAQQLGLSITEIREALTALPNERTPTKRDWTRLSRSIRRRLDDQIAMMERLRDRLDGCIGCGCLSLKTCALYNPEDKAAQLGSGPRYVISAKKL
ncbi:redox-sensitive transcriptional activator SoxR [Hyphomonas sp. FCG-A18]|nr:redox-sensitive transcriptional activator SoxR [Hyphomonas sp. FCG-A18]